MRAGMRQYDISPTNLIANDGEGKLSWHSFLVDLDFANKRIVRSLRRREGRLARECSRSFQDNEPYSFMHDLQCSFWVCFCTYMHTLQRVVRESLLTFRQMELCDSDHGGVSLVESGHSIRQ